MMAANTRGGGPVFALDESTVTVAGHRYEAIESAAAPMNCTGGPRCVFAVGFGCDLMLPTSGHTHCGSNERRDRRSIVWVLPAARAQR